jgi:ribosomal-protein-alanine N-acetyltransferase
MVIKRGYRQLLDEAMAQVTTLSVEQAEALHGRDDVVFVDVRDVRELEREGLVPGAVHAPRGMLEFWVDPQSPYHREVFARAGVRYVLFCAAGWRSALAARTLQDMGLDDVAHIEGGFTAWKQAGAPVAERAAPADSLSGAMAVRDGPPMRVPRIAGFAVRPIRLEDAPSWARYACLPEVKEHTSSTATTVEDVAAVIRRTLAGEPGSPIHFVLTLPGSEAVVATVGFHTVSALFGTAEITYDVAPSHWGRGIATAACAAAARWGFEARGWHRIQATTLLAHARSQRVLERCGFQREGLVRNFRVVRGAPADYWLYAVLPGEARDAAVPAGASPEAPVPAGCGTAPR